MIKLGGIVTDSATGATGMAVARQIELDRSVNVLLQPKGLNPKNGEPVKGVYVVEQRLTGGEQEVGVDYPYHILGTDVEDTATGYKGMAIALIVHISGCVHLLIQAKGRNEDGGPIHPQNFDIRRCAGPAIAPMTVAEVEQDKKVHPSPNDGPCFVREV